MVYRLTGQSISPKNTHIISFHAHPQPILWGKFRPPRCAVAPSESSRSISRGTSPSRFDWCGYSTDGKLCPKWLNIASIQPSKVWTSRKSWVKKRLRCTWIKNRPGPFVTSLILGWSKSPSNKSAISVAHFLHPKSHFNPAPFATTPDEASLCSGNSGPRWPNKDHKLRNHHLTLKLLRHESFFWICLNFQILFWNCLRTKKNMFEKIKKLTPSSSNCSSSSKAFRAFLSTSCTKFRRWNEPAIYDRILPWQEVW